MLFIIGIFASGYTRKVRPMMGMDLCPALLLATCPGKNKYLYMMAEKSIYTKVLGKRVAKHALRSTIGKYHIIPNGAYRWSVVPKGSIRASKVFTSKAGAVQYARKAAVRKMISEIIIHSAKGDIVKKIAV